MRKIITHSDNLLTRSALRTANKYVGDAMGADPNSCLGLPLPVIESIS